MRFAAICTSMHYYLSDHNFYRVPFLCTSELPPTRGRSGAIRVMVQSGDRVRAKVRVTARVSVTRRMMVSDSHQLVWFSRLCPSDR